MSLSIGAPAPLFTAKDQSGAAVSLSDFGGKYVVLYFYPKDDTPGCTIEACSFRDDHSKLQAAGAVVLGVSPDSEASHQKFIAKFSLPFSLLVDTDNALSTAYGAWGEKSMYGRTYMGVIRSTFLIGPDGAVAYAWPKVKVNGHSAEVLAAIEAHRSGQSIEAALAALPSDVPAPAPTVPGKAQGTPAAAPKPAAKKAVTKKPAAKKLAAKKKPAVKKKSAPKKATAKKKPAPKKKPAKKAARSKR